MEYWIQNAMHQCCYNAASSNISSRWFSDIYFMHKPVLPRLVTSWNVTKTDRMIKQQWQKTKVFLQPTMQTLVILQRRASGVRFPRLISITIRIRWLLKLTILPPMHWYRYAFLHTPWTVEMSCTNHCNDLFVKNMVDVENSLCQTLLSAYWWYHYYLNM